MIYNLIQKRTSVRTFQDNVLKVEDLQWINEVIEEISKEKGPNGTKIKFQLVDTNPNGNKGANGTYGFIKNGQIYITSTIPNENASIEDYGYLLEKIIIFLVKRNFGTCWLGGTFKRKDFSDILNIKKGQIIPAVDVPFEDYKYIMTYEW